MTENRETHVEVSTGFVRARLADAIVTALTHGDSATQQRAEQKIRDWQQVLDGSASGALRIGSRTPLAGMPAWVTPRVIYGGFTVGVLAGGDLLPHEVELAQRIGAPASRKALFVHYLTEEGQRELCSMLDSGAYTIEAPEEAVLLTIAWLLRVGDSAAASRLLLEVSRFAGELRFAPRPGGSAAVDPDVVCRVTVGELREQLLAKKPNRRVEAQREALTVWNPFADELLQFWLETTTPLGDKLPRHLTVGRRIPEGWIDRGRALLDRYAELAAEHTLCTKHKDPGSNMGILRHCLEKVVEREERMWDLRPSVRYAVQSMVDRRGLPGSSRHYALRERQAAQSAVPSHRSIAVALSDRLDGLPQDHGIEDVDGVLSEPLVGLEGGQRVPRAIVDLVRRAKAAPLPMLIADGLVPSAEVLASFVPQMTAAAVAQGYPDQTLSPLIAAAYRAFRTRRSVLLLNLERQVQFEELPWVQAVAGHGGAGGQKRAARATLLRLGELALTHFPATILPNPLVKELAVLANVSGSDTPYVEEIAADIFEGRFSAKFGRAVQTAVPLLRGSLYEQYFGIDYRELDRLLFEELRDGATQSQVLADLCRTRAGQSSWFGGVAGSGKVLEQCQILTTHNLAALVTEGAVPKGEWHDVAREAFRGMVRLLGRVDGNRRPLPMVKDAAYAWRQSLFFLSLCTSREQQQFLAWAYAQLDKAPEKLPPRIRLVLIGLGHAMADGSFDEDGMCPAGRRFTGWSTNGHWMVEMGREPVTIGR